MVPMLTSYIECLCDSCVGLGNMRFFLVAHPLLDPCTPSQSRDSVQAFCFLVCFSLLVYFVLALPLHRADGMPQMQNEHLRLVVDWTPQLGGLGHLWPHIVAITLWILVTGYGGKLGSPASMHIATLCAVASFALAFILLVITLGNVLRNETPYEALQRNKSKAGAAPAITADGAREGLQLYLGCAPGWWFVWLMPSFAYPEDTILQQQFSSAGGSGAGEGGVAEAEALLIEAKGARP